jgi:hypothetical protein
VRGLVTGSRNRVEEEPTRPERQDDACEEVGSEDARREPREPPPSVLCRGEDEGRSDGARIQRVDEADGEDERNESSDRPSLERKVQVLPSGAPTGGNRQQGVQVIAAIGGYGLIGILVIILLIILIVYFARRA